MKKKKIYEFLVQYMKSKKSQKKKEEKRNFFDDLKILGGHSLYVLSVTCRCILHGINTCLHFWLADFLRTVIHEQNQLKITIYYSIICFAGPVGGMIANAVLKPFIIS